MAITAETKTTDFSGFLPAPIAAPIFERAAHQSVVQRLAQRVTLGASGVQIPYVTGRPNVGWIAEGVTKPGTSGSLALETMTPKKVAAIITVSAEVVRANPGNYINIVRNDLADAFAFAFDRAALHDEGPDGTAGGGPFSTYLDQTTKVSELGAAAASAGGVHTDLVNVMSDIVSDVDSTGRRYRLNGWALDAVVEPVLWGALDANGRPLYTELPTDQVSSTLSTAGRLLGRPSFIGEGVASANLTSVVGYGGDFSQAAWGTVGGISYDVSTQATVTINGSLVSLWENNLLAIRAEAEYAFLVHDTAAFSKLVNVGNSPVTSS